MGPQHRPVAPPSRRTAPRVQGRLEQRGPIDLLVALRCEARDDQLPGVGGHEVPVAVAHEIRRPESTRRRQGIALPESLPGRCVDATQLAVAVDAIQVVIDDDRGRHHRVEPVGQVWQLAPALSLPEHSRRGTIVVERHHHRPGAELADEEIPAAVHRRADRQPAGVPELLLPVGLACLGIEGHQGGRVPEDQLSRAARVDDNRRRVAGF